MNQHLYNTPLSNRTLWYDGDSSYNPTQLISLINKGYKVDWVDYITPEIVSYNNIASSEIKIKENCNPLNMQWNLPKKYLDLDVFDYVITKHVELTKHLNSDEIEKRDKRLVSELIKYKETKMLDVLRTIIYIINRLTSERVIWGIGRGSSVSSYVLYIIGVHDVDSFKYELSINDFLHD